VHHLATLFFNHLFIECACSNHTGPTCRPFFLYYTGGPLLFCRLVETTISRSLPRPWSPARTSATTPSARQSTNSSSTDPDRKFPSAASPWSVIQPRVTRTTRRKWKPCDRNQKLKKKECSQWNSSRSFFYWLVSFRMDSKQDSFSLERLWLNACETNVAK
jgi:hypothetical protein